MGNPCRLNPPSPPQQPDRPSPPPGNKVLGTNGSRWSTPPKGCPHILILWVPENEILLGGGGDVAAAIRMSAVPHPPPVQLQFEHAVQPKGGSTGTARPAPQYSDRQLPRCPNTQKSPGLAQRQAAPSTGSSGSQSYKCTQYSAVTTTLSGIMYVESKILFLGFSNKKWKVSSQSYRFSNYINDNKI
jgi:hypothetical protein